MIQHIFCFIGNNINELDELNIYSYPEKFPYLNDKQFIKNFFLGQELETNVQIIENNNHLKYTISEPKAQVLKGLNIFSTCINQKIHVGLIFEQNDNPFDYREYFLELLNEYLNCESFSPFDEETNIENFLITLFIDLRRYGDEVVEKYPKIELTSKTKTIKLFLFGIDGAGKSSLVRRIKTGQYDDNYFMPTRKFNIEYVQEDERLLALWDMPGQQNFRKKWLLGIQESNIITFMIDVANPNRFEESKQAFWKILNRYELYGVPLIILANKIDLINDASKKPPDEHHLSELKARLFELFELDAIENREWTFLFTSVKTNYNIDTFIRLVREFSRKTHHKA
ncbi:MAG: ADP-ribosylation factor-like protein [Promethearchaeota archaeon]